MTKKQPTVDELLTVKQCAEILGVCPRTIKRYTLRKPGLKYRKFNDVMLITRDDLNEFKAICEREGTPLLIAGRKRKNAE